MPCTFEAVKAALQYLAPEFIKEGRLCWLRSPLYIVTNGKQESYYFTDEEMDAARDKIKGEVQRNKGLGSLEPEQARRAHGCTSADAGRPVRT